MGIERQTAKPKRSRHRAVSETVDAPQVLTVADQPDQSHGPHAAAVSFLSEGQRAELQHAAVLAVENNATCTLQDAANRTWFVGVDIVDNRSTVLVQARRGQVAHGMNLPTPTLSPAAVASAIAEIDARNFD